MAKIRLYTITVPRASLGYEDQVEQACEGGADAVLFDDPGMSPKAILTQGAVLKKICHKYRALFLIAGRPDLAAALNADGVHLGPDDIPIRWARHVIGPGKVIVASSFSLGNATAAAQDGADLVVVGPIFTRAGKQTAALPHGVDMIRLIKKRIRVPMLAAGGIAPHNVPEVIATAADGVLAVHSVMGARDIRSAARAMKEAIIQELEKTAGEKKSGAGKE